MPHPCTGVILSGGLSTRFHGINKALISIGGMRILDRLYRIFSDLFDEIILVTNDPGKFVDWDLTIVTDILPVRSSLTGIHAGLFYMNNSFGFFTACDTPFLQKPLVELLLEKIDGQSDIIMPETAAGLEPLCAIYSRRCLNTAEHYIKQDKFKIQRALGGHRWKKIPESKLRLTDPELISFFNINTPEEMAQAEEMEAENDAHRA